MGGRKWMHFTSTQLEQTNINCVHVPAVMNTRRSINAAFSPSAHRRSGYWVLKARSPQGCYWKVVGLRGGRTCFFKVLVGMPLMISMNDIMRLYLLLFHLSFLHKINGYFHHTPCHCMFLYHRSKESVSVHHELQPSRPWTKANPFYLQVNYISQLAMCCIGKNMNNSLRRCPLICTWTKSQRSVDLISGALLLQMCVFACAHAHIWRPEATLGVILKSTVHLLKDGVPYWARAHQLGQTSLDIARLMDSLTHRRHLWAVNLARASGRC